MAGEDLLPAPQAPRRPNPNIERLMGRAGQAPPPPAPAPNGASSWQPPAPRPGGPASTGPIANQAQAPMNRVAGQVQTLANRPVPTPGPSSPAPTPAAAPPAAVSPAQQAKGPGINPVERQMGGLAQQARVQGVTGPGHTIAPERLPKMMTGAGVPQPPAPAPAPVPSPTGVVTRPNAPAPIPQVNGPRTVLTQPTTHAALPPAPQPPVPSPSGVVSRQAAQAPVNGPRTTFNGTPTAPPPTPRVPPTNPLAEYANSKVSPRVGSTPVEGWNAYTNPANKLPIPGPSQTPTPTPGGLPPEPPNGWPGNMKPKGFKPTPSLWPENMTTPPGTAPGVAAPGAAPAVTPAAAIPKAGLGAKLGAAGKGLWNSGAGRVGRGVARGSLPLVALDALHNMGDEAVQNVADLAVGHNTPRGHGDTSFMGMPIGHTIDDWASLLATGHPMQSVSAASVGPTAGQRAANGTIPPTTSTDAMFQAAQANPGATVNPDGRGGTAITPSSTQAAAAQSPAQGGSFQSVPPSPAPRLPAGNSGAFNPGAGYDMTGRPTSDLTDKDIDAIFKGARVFGGSSPQRPQVSQAGGLAGAMNDPNMQWMRDQMKALQGGAQGGYIDKQRAAMHQALAGAYGQAVASQIQAQGHVQGAIESREPAELLAARREALIAGADKDRRPEVNRPKQEQEAATALTQNRGDYYNHLIAQGKSHAEAMATIEASEKLRADQERLAKMTPTQRRQTKADSNVHNSAWNKKTW